MPGSVSGRVTTPPFCKAAGYDVATAETVLQVGMTCASCSVAWERALLKGAGRLRASVNSHGAGDDPGAVDRACRRTQGCRGQGGIRGQRFEEW